MGRNTVMTCCNNDIWRNHVISWNFTFLVTCLHGQCFIRVVTTSAMPLWFAFLMALVRLCDSVTPACAHGLVLWVSDFFPNNLQAIVAEERCAEKEKNHTSNAEKLGSVFVPIKMCCQSKICCASVEQCSQDAERRLQRDDPAPESCLQSVPSDFLRSKMKKHFLLGIALL